MKISILSLFPKMFAGPFDFSIVKRAQKDKLVKIEFVNIRDFGLGKHKIVDDKPYGGGVGMIMRVDVLKAAIDQTIDKKLKKDEQKIILLSTSGKTYSQKLAKDFSSLKHLILICGHYEGVDGRVKKFVDEEISIGSFVLTGGEIAAMIIVDSTVRLIPGVLKTQATENESFSTEDLLEHPQYTRPKKFKNLIVPKVLLSGNHQKINEWKKFESLKITEKIKSSQKVKNLSGQKQ